MKLISMINLESVLEIVLIKWMIVQHVLLKKFRSKFKIVTFSNISN
jgi:hypothetical protein